MPEQAHTLSYNSEAAAALDKLIRCCLLWPHICPEDKQMPINKSAIFIFFKYPLKRSRMPDLILVESAAALYKTDFERSFRFEIESSYKKKNSKNPMMAVQQEPNENRKRLPKKRCSASLFHISRSRGPSSIRELVVVNANGAKAVKVMASPSGLLSRIKPRLETGRREI